MRYRKPIDFCAIASNEAFCGYFRPVAYVILLAVLYCMWRDGAVKYAPELVRVRRGRRFW